jgi:hypothetical protein
MILAPIIIFARHLESCHTALDSGWEQFQCKYLKQATIEKDSVCQTYLGRSKLGRLGVSSAQVATCFLKEMKRTKLEEVEQ